MELTNDKPRYVPVNHPAEIEAILRGFTEGDLSAPIGGEVNGRYFAYQWSIERYRKRQAKVNP